MAALSSFYYVGDGRVGEALSVNLIKAGFQPASSLDAADLVLTFCLSQDDLEEVYLGEGGLVTSANSETYLVDCSATTPAFAKEVAAVATVSDLHYVEAPFYVVDAARPQALSDRDNVRVLAAGEEDDVAACLPLLEAIAQEVIRCGAAGSAQLVKCSLTLEQAIALLGQVESDALRRTLVGSGSASKLGTLVARAQRRSDEAAAFAQAVEEGAFAGEYTVEIMLAELHAALDQADELNLITPLAESAEYLLRLLAVVGGMDLAPAALTLMYRDEEECAKHGLDWARAEEAWGPEDEDDLYGYDDDDDELRERRRAYYRDEFGYEEFGYPNN